MNNIQSNSTPSNNSTFLVFGRKVDVTDLLTPSSNLKQQAPLYLMMRGWYLSNFEKKPTQSTNTTSNIPTNDTYIIRKVPVSKHEIPLHFKSGTDLVNRRGRFKDKKNLIQELKDWCKKRKKVKKEERRGREQEEEFLCSEVVL